MEFKDYYDTLGVDETADADAIKRAYRRQARRHHPDVNRDAGAEERFKAVNEAYAVLRDSEKRQAYDELRRSPHRDGIAFEPPDWRGAADFSDVPSAAADASAFSDFFQTLFGRDSAEGRGEPGHEHYPLRGADVHGTIEISLEEACRGGRRHIELNDRRIGPDGSVESVTRRLAVGIPAGVTGGRRIRLGGQGAAGRGGGAPGDLYLEVRIAPHPVFGVQGRDVEMSLPAAPWEAALGATVETPTLHGPVNLRIPPGSTSGTRMRLRGKGLPGDTPGDQFAVLRVETPPAETEGQRQRYRDLETAFDFDPRRDLRARAARATEDADG